MDCDGFSLLYKVEYQDTCLVYNNSTICSDWPNHFTLVYESENCMVWRKAAPRTHRQRWLIVLLVLAALILAAACFWGVKRFAAKRKRSKKENEVKRRTFRVAGVPLT